MRLVILLALLGLHPVLAARAETARATTQERGTYWGTGRACYGKLTITASSIAWMTPFSRCAASAFSVKDRQENATGLHVTYLLQHPGPKCRYPVIMLTHDAGSDSGIGWNVVGFPSLSAYDPDKPQTGLSCYLVK